MTVTMASLLRDISPLEVSLPEGPELLLRPLEKRDRERVRVAYSLLSPESRINRFWEKPAELSHVRASSLTDTDNRNHVAWAALSPRDESLPGYAGASFWRDGEDSDRAELTFTVADAWQRHGFATLLFSIVYFDGWRSGIRRFHGSARLANTAMAGWWESMGGRVETGSRAYEMEMDLLPPEEFVEKVAFEMPPSRRRVETAEWLREWSGRLENGGA